MRDMYQHFSVAEGMFSGLSSIVRILLPNPPLSADESSMKFSTVAPMTNFAEGCEMGVGAVR